MVGVKNNFIFIYFVQLIKDLSFCLKLKFSKPNILASEYCITFDISNLDYLIYKNSEFEISKVYDIGLQSYNDWKIRVCDKDSIPLLLYLYSKMYSKYIMKMC